MKTENLTMAFFTMKKNILPPRSAKKRILKEALANRKP